MAVDDGLGSVRASAMDGCVAVTMLLQVVRTYVVDDVIAGLGKIVVANIVG